MALKHVATHVATNMSGSRTCAKVVKIRATLPSNCKPRVMGDNSPVLLRRKLSAICGTRARLRMGIEHNCKTMRTRNGIKGETNIVTAMIYNKAARNAGTRGSR